MFSKTDVQNSFHETLKITVMVLAYLNVKNITCKNNIHILLFFAAFTTAAFGMVAYCAKWVAQEYVFADGILRLQSFFKYSNAAACFLGCGYFSAVSVLTGVGNTYLKNGAARYFVKVASGTVLLALYLTFSKAAIPMFLFVGTLLYFKNAEKITFFIAQNMIMLPCAGLILLLSAEFNGIVIFIIAATFLAVSGIAESSKYVIVFRNTWLFVMLFGFVGCLIYAFFNPSILSTAFQRFGYSADALPLITKYPVFGFGAGSWRYLQYSVRSQAYDVGYLHNGWLELTVENGWLVFLLLFGVIVRIVFIGICHGKSEFVPGVLLITIHSFFDIDMSFGTIMLTLGMLVSCASDEVYESTNCVQRTSKKFAVFKHVVLFVSAAIGIVFVYFGLSEMSLTEKFEKAYESGNLQKAQEIALRYEKQFSDYAEPLYWIASIRQSMGAPDNEIESYLKRAVSLSPMDTEKYENYMLFAATKENIDDLCKEYIRRAPKRKETYEYVKQFLYYVMGEGLLSPKECQDKQVYYHNLYRTNNNITTPVLCIKNDIYTDFISLYVSNNIQYIPIRNVFEDLGFLVEYSEKNKQINLTDGSIALILNVGGKTADCNKKVVTLQFGVENIDGKAVISIDDFVSLTGFVFEEEEYGYSVQRQRQ